MQPSEARHSAAIVRHVLAAIVVLATIASGVCLFFVNFDRAANHGFGLHFTNLIWGLYYGIGFEPGFVWYKIHGPYRTGFFDLFGALIYPLIASAVLYAAIIRLAKYPSAKWWLLLSILVIIPLPLLPSVYWWLLPLYAYGALSLPP